ncbi:hypothetical protein CWR43_30270 [Rhizobium sullae]|uniref:Acyltransferase n=1 Tax=Rhizobium sullae TaxID=50338 RepID=A0A2N0D1G5_RHISU|nr:hypothetical protein CWR43_30270 [Rhizobium sullae]
MVLSNLRRTMQVGGLTEGSGNRILGSAVSSEKCRVTFHGRNATLIIGDRCSLDNSNFKLYDGAVIAIGENSRYTGSILAHIGCLVTLGANLQANGFLNISSAEETKVTLGKDCLISSATIRSSDMHPIYDLETNERVNMGADVTIGDHVWFGQESIVLKGVTIGSGCVLALRSMVTRDVEPNCVVGGSPAKILRRNIRWHSNLPLRRGLTDHPSMIRP